MADPSEIHKIPLLYMLASKQSGSIVRGCNAHTWTFAPRRFRDDVINVVICWNRRLRSLQLFELQRSHSQKMRTVPCIMLQPTVVEKSSWCSGRYYESWGKLLLLQVCSLMFNFSVEKTSQNFPISIAGQAIHCPWYPIDTETQGVRQIPSPPHAKDPFDSHILILRRWCWCRCHWA